MICLYAANSAASMRRRDSFSPPRPRFCHGTRLAISFGGEEAFSRTYALGLNGIMSSALSALQANTQALGIVSGNVANINTPGYARRVVTMGTLEANGQLQGVDVEGVQRATDQFINQEVLSAGSSSSQYSAQTSIFKQLDGLLGSPGDGNALTSKLSNIYSALGEAALSPTASTSQTAVLNSLKDFATSVSSLSTSLSTLQQQADTQVASSIGTVNGLIKQVYDLNTQIQIATSAGDTSSALLDQRDVALQSLSQYVDVRTTPQSDGSVTVMTQDGISLVGSTYAQLSYSASQTGGTYQPIQLQTINPSNGQPIGAVQSLDQHLSGGSIKGLIDMRDGTLADLQNELGSLAQGVSQTLNAQHNANSAYPPPTSLNGRDTGLLSTDSLNFTGKTTVAVVDSSGNMVQSVDLDFGANQYSTDGGNTWTSFTPTIDGLTNALNTALGSNGSASFNNGQLSIAATGTNGIVVQDDATTPSSRGGTGFSQFFGLNDLFESAGPSVSATGLSASDASGLAADGNITLQIKGPNGDIVQQASTTITTGMTIGQAIAALNQNLAGAATLTLNSDGSVSTQVAAGYPNYQLQVVNDTTARGTTGVSLTNLFGIGSNQLAQQAVGFQVTPDIANDPSRLAFATPDVTSNTVVGSGDSSGLEALQNLFTTPQKFAQAGDIGAQTVSLNDYAAGFYQDEATRSTTATDNATSQSARLTEAQTRQSSTSGVNLDEELTNMMSYQQAYAAGARMLNVADQLYTTLLQIQ
jgi:flagellar hook-associated protein 1 FlgK